MMSVTRAEIEIYEWSDDVTYQPSHNRQNPHDSEKTQHHRGEDQQRSQAGITAVTLGEDRGQGGRGHGRFQHQNLFSQVGKIQPQSRPEYQQRLQAQVY